MHHVTIRKARGGYVVETDEPELYATPRLNEALRIAATHLSGQQYHDSRIGDVIVLTPVDSGSSRDQ